MAGQQLPVASHTTVASPPQSTSPATPPPSPTGPRPPWSLEQLKAISTDPTLDLERDAQYFSPLELAALQMLQERAKEKARPTDWNTLGGMAGAAAADAIVPGLGMAARPFMLNAGRTIGAGAGGTITDMIQRLLKGEDQDVGESMVEGAKQATPSAIAGAAAPLLQAVTPVSGAARKHFAETKVSPQTGNVLPSTGSTRPTISALLKHEILPGTTGEFKALRLADEAGRGPFAANMKKLADEVKHKPTEIGMGGLSMRDRVRLALGIGVAPVAHALYRGQINPARVDDLMRLSGSLGRTGKQADRALEETMRRRGTGGK